MRTFARILCGKYICRKTIVCQFLCGKQKLSITSICSCVWLVTYLSHVFICTFAKLCAIIALLLKPIFCVESKHICCIIYTSNRICHGKLSNKNCSCKRGFTCECKKYHTRYYICNPARLLMCWPYLKLYYYHHFFTLMMHIAHLPFDYCCQNWISGILKFL